MKKTLILLLAALFCLVAAGCGSSVDKGEKEALLDQYQKSVDALKTQKVAIDKTLATLQGQSNAIGTQIQSLEAVHAGLSKEKEPGFLETYWFIFLILIPIFAWLGYNIWEKKKGGHAD